MDSSAPRTASPGRSGVLRLHRVAPLVLLVVGVAALVGAYGLGLGELTRPGPGLWPFLVAVLVAGTAVVLVVVDDPADYERWTGQTARIAAGLLSLGVFIGLFGLIGFLVPAFGMLVLWLRVFGGESWRWALGLAEVPRCSRTTTR